MYIFPKYSTMREYPPDKRAAVKFYVASDGTTGEQWNFVYQNALGKVPK